MHVNTQLVILILVVLYFDPSLGKPGDVTQTCNCTQVSSSGTYCFAQTCISTTEEGGGTKCFSGRSTVQMRDESNKPLSSVQIGEEVLIFDGVRLTFEPIYDFIHMERTGIYDFLRLTFIVNSQRNLTSSIDISSDHLIFVYGKLAPIFASEIRVGGKLQVAEDGELIPGEVIHIEKVKSQGFYAPLTRSGTIVIDRVVSSNYASARNHHLAHLTMQPYRWWRMLVGPKTSISNEMNWYASALHVFAEKTGFLLLL